MPSYLKLLQVVESSRAHAQLRWPILPSVALGEARDEARLLHLDLPQNVLHDLADLADRLVDDGHPRLHPLDIIFVDLVNDFRLLLNHVRRHEHFRRLSIDILVDNSFNKRRELLKPMARLHIKFALKSTSKTRREKSEKHFSLPLDCWVSQ